MIVVEPPLWDEYQAMLKTLTAEQETLRLAFVAALDESGVSPKTIADACEITEQAVSNWKRTGKIARRYLPIIAALTGWTVHGLLTNQKDTPAADDAWKLSADEQNLVLAFRDIDEASQQEVLADLTALAERTRAHVMKLLKERYNVTGIAPNERVAEKLPPAPKPTPEPKLIKGGLRGLKNQKKRKGDGK